MKNMCLPSEIKDIKDCWTIAVVIIAIMYKRDYKIIPYIYNFQYNINIKREASLRSIIVNHMEINLESNDLILQNQLYMIKKLLFLNLRCYKKNEAIKMHRNLSVNKKQMEIIWFDAFDCYWNPMYKKEHILHCVAAMYIEKESCFIYDSLKDKDNAFIVNYKVIDNLCKYVFCFDEDNTFKYEAYGKETLKHYLNVSCWRERLLEVNIYNIKQFYSDICKISQSKLNDEIKNMNTVKLFIRLLDSQREKMMLQLNWNSEFIDDGKILIYINNLKKEWQEALADFSRVCFGAESRRWVNYCEFKRDIWNVMEEMLCLKSYLEECYDERNTVYTF